MFHLVTSRGRWSPRILIIVCVSVLCLITNCQAASLAESRHTDTHNTDFAPDEVGFSSWPVAAVIASVCVLVGGILLVMGCADICQKHAGFKDFDNDTFNTEDTLSPVPAPSSEFTMYPPVENTPDSITPVVFEPLPDLASRGYLDQDSRRSGRLRPRVTQDVYERSESVDSLDDVAHRDRVQDKIRLQNLLTNSRQQVPRGQLQYIKELGNGWFGKVLQGEGHNILPGHKKTKVVIQMLKEEQDTQDQMAFLEEVMPYRDTDHANVVKLLGQCVDTAPFLNILELCPFGDVKTYLRSHRVAMESFNEKGLLEKFACDMAAGLQALHQEGFVHRDFACRNCLLASDLSVKVGDYGVSEETFKEDYYMDSSGDALPIRWLAPECMMVSTEEASLRRITKEANIWAYGVSMWEILTFGAMPYGDLTNNHVLRLVIMEKSVRLPKPDVNFSNLNRLYQLMQLCWSIPEDRPSLRELRIMLLHLLSKKDNDSDSAAFDMKWNQLMPRRSPRVTRVRGPDGKFSPSPVHANGSIQTVSGGAPSVVGGLPNTSVSSNMPSVMSGEDDPSNVATLNVSKLGLAGSHESLTKTEPAEPKHVWSKPSELTSPVNEKSLEAEFSAANVAAVLDTDVKIVSETGKERGEQKVKEIQKADLGMGEDLFSPIKSDDSESQIRQSQQSDDTLNDTATTADDQVVPGTPVRSGMKQGEQAPSPTMLKGPPEFVTSTPKKPEQNTPTTNTDLYTTAVGGVTIETSKEASQPTGTFHTAHSYSSQSSIDRSLSVDMEDRSFMAPNKFADILRTVAMTPSVDDEMLDTSNENSPSVLDLSESDVFQSPVKSLGDLGRLEEELSTDSPLNDSIDGTISGENTPRNTPTPPLASSAVPLLDTSGGSHGDSTLDKPDGAEVPEVTVTDDRGTPTPQLPTSRAPLLDVSGGSPTDETTGGSPASEGTADSKSSDGDGPLVKSEEEGAAGELSAKELTSGSSTGDMNKQITSHDTDSD